MQPARHECHACCLQRAENVSIPPVLGNMHDTRVEWAASSLDNPQGTRNSLAHQKLFCDQKNYSYKIDPLITFFLGEEKYTLSKSLWKTKNRA